MTFSFSWLWVFLFCFVFVKFFSRLHVRFDFWPLCWCLATFLCFLLFFYRNKKKQGFLKTKQLCRKNKKLYCFLHLAKKQTKKVSSEICLKKKGRRGKMFFVLFDKNIVRLGTRIRNLILREVSQSFIEAFFMCCLRSHLTLMFKTSFFFKFMLKKTKIIRNRSKTRSKFLESRHPKFGALIEKWNKFPKSLVRFSFWIFKFPKSSFGPNKFPKIQDQFLALDLFF